MYAPAGQTPKAGKLGIGKSVGLTSKLGGTLVVSLANVVRKGAHNITTTTTTTISNITHHYTNRN